MNQIVIGTAGHIDHGKTALVKALTGVDTDRLQEEKSRGMTIDLGFAFLNKNITIIDVPGHEKFIRNMVSGVSTIHIALVVVAADDGVMPQTKEHLQILSLLCIPQGVIVLTKTDMVSDPDWLDLVEMEIHEIVAGTSLESAPIIRTSVNPESGISELRQALLHEAGKVRFTVDRGFFRLPIDRVFQKTGFGIVVTGTVISGSLSVGNEIYCQPVGKKCKVRGLQSHGEKTETASMGDRVAVNVVGIEKNQAWRGAELVQSGWIASTSIFIAHVQMIPG
ncbi:MAG: selenocysteine-specific translation elongation factor, partial [Dehalococcoidia bacterium]|nr:selenocysteine-specific translation elongation factor [Dehalococcoidia bacterium]